MTTKRQRRTFNPAPEQSTAKVLVETAQTIHINSAVIDPRTLSYGSLASRPQPQKRRLIKKCKPVIRPNRGTCQRKFHRRNPTFHFPCGLDEVGGSSHCLSFFDNLPRGFQQQAVL